MSEATDPQGAFAELALILIGAQPLVQVLQRVATLAQTVVPHALDVSVTLVESPAPGRPVTTKAATVAFTGDLAVDLDERQYQVGHGPCLDAAVSGETITVDSATDDLYPEFTRAARHRGVTHILAVGIPIPQQTLGAINAYTDGQPFTVAEVKLLQGFAAYAAVALANAAVFASTVDLASHLQVALRSRAVIEQAKGIVMAKRGCTADEAFGVLRKASQDFNVKLRDVCQQVVDRATTPPS